jgi:hypothetical protein
MAPATDLQPTASVPASSTAALQYFKQSLDDGSLRHVDVLSGLLNLKPLELDSTIAQALKDHVFVGVDMEWFEKFLKQATELGVSIMERVKHPGLQPRRLHKLPQGMFTFHIRIKEHAHLRNTYKGAGDPEKFQFGKSIFMTKAEGRKTLIHAFLQPHVDAKSSSDFRPVILVGHDVKNDIDQLKEKMGIDLAKLGTVACILDTQVMAAELKLNTPVHLPMSLKNLLARFSIREPFLHNAGNDIAQTMNAAWLLAHENASPGCALGKQYNTAEAWSMKLLAQSREAGHGPPSFLFLGSITFCTRCDSTAHCRADCRETLTCTKCKDHARYHLNHKTHKTEKCIQEVIVPCQSCTVSPVRERWMTAILHEDGDCPFWNLLPTQAREKESGGAPELFPTNL